MAEASGEQHDTKHLEGGRQMHWVRVAGTYAAAASPAHQAGPPATAPRRWIHPSSTSVPSRSAAHCSTRPRSAPRRGKTSPRSPGGQHRDGWLGASELKGISVQFWDITFLILLCLICLHLAAGSPAQRLFMC